MEHRHRPYGPHAPPGSQPGRWVVAGEEEPQRPRPGDRGQPPEWYPPPYDPGYGGQRYGELPEPGYPADPYQTNPYQTDPYQTGPYSPEPYPPAAPYDPPPAYPPEPPTPAYPAVRRRPPPPPPPADDLVEPPAPAWAPALLWTVGLFLVPVLVYLGWALTLSGVAPAACVDGAGDPCPPPRTDEVRQLGDALPAIAAALALSLLVALGIRRIAGDWRGFTVGFAGAVIGAGLTTLVAAVLR